MKLRPFATLLFLSVPGLLRAEGAAPVTPPAAAAGKGIAVQAREAASGAPALAPVTVQQDTEKPKVVFSFLPRSVQKNPFLDMTAITEMTLEGKKRAPATPENPEYYIAAPGGFKPMGWQTASGEKPPSEEEMQAIMQRALAKNGFLPSDSTHAPSLVLIYHWGSFARADTRDPETSTITPEMMYRELLDRARLVGGDKFASELAQAMEARFRLMDSQVKNRDLPDGGSIPNIMGDAATNLTGAFFDPVEQFLAKSKTTRFLAEQSDTGLYYVIASAFDATAMAKNQRVLLWRTKMTVDASGVSMAQTLPTLVANSSAYFGREMNGPATVVQRMKEGHVELGEPTVVRYEDDAGNKKTESPAKK